ncbi:COG1361 S-layer family protein [Natrinema halophilum]|uniref:DUF11 domain-containing protein n=1 Tax=Natrinema halophilum TaxID=1699371 RepID=A0A7D5L3D0_9EURY|nr:DUF11 domain-containing protein [Natrinema halophilum]QLG49045.1 hypothetical protein HYG82_09385 [Natrinema halophilum]
MTGQADGSKRYVRRRTGVAGCLLVALVISSVPAAFIAGPTAAVALQDGPARNDTNTNDSTATQTSGQRTPPGGTSPEIESDTAPRGVTDQEAAAALGDETSAAEIPRARPPDENVTVAVAENQSVRAGDAATIALEVTNDGDEEVTDVVVTVRALDSALTLGSADARQATQSVYLEDIWSGDTETVDLDIAAADVEPGTYPLFASVRYTIDEDDDEDDEFGDVIDDDTDTDSDDEDDANETVVADGLSPMGLSVVESRSLDVTPRNGGIPVDGTGTYEVEITNDGTEPVMSLVAAINVSPPLSTDSPTAYIGMLDPGESETVRFPLESSTDAVETTASATVVLTYDTGTGQRTSTDPVPIPVSIVDDEEADIDSVAPFAAVAVIFVLAAIWWLRRR